MAIQARMTIFDPEEAELDGASDQIAIPGAINLPVDELRERLEEAPDDRPLAVYCKVGMRGYLAARILLQSGFPGVRNLSGGYTSWQRYRATKPTMVVG